MIKTIGNNISHKETTCSVESELDLIANPSHGDEAYVIATQKNYIYDGMTAKWVEQKKTESDVTREEFDDLADKVDELQLYKFPNATIVGEPTINNGQISGFSQTNYLRFPFLVDFKNKPFVIDVEFMTGANVTSQENIFDSDFGLAFAIRNARFVFAVSSNGTSWNIGEGVGTYTVLANTTYRVRLAWDGSNYTLAYSLDGGKTYITDITKAAAQQPYPKQIFIGVGQSDVTVLNAFSGVINLNQAYLYIEDKLIWQGMDDVGLATRLSVDLDNLDPDGEARIKEIAGKKLELAELKMLGWNTPKACAIQNEVSGNTFIQKVGRLSLKDRYWNADGIGVGSINVFRMPILLNTKTYGNNVKWNIYVEGYTTRPLVTDHVHDVTSNDMSVGGRNAGGNYIEFSTTAYTTRDQFKAYMDNAELYLYYELSTPIIKKIDGNEVVENKVDIIHVTHFAGDGRTITTQAIFDAGVKEGTYIINAHRSESSSSTLFYVYFASYADEIVDFECHKIVGQGDTIELVDGYTLKYMGADEQPSDTVTFDFIKITDFNNF